MKIIWRNHAIIQRFNIVQYILQTFGRKSAKKFISDVERCKNLIKKNPLIAPEEELLKGQGKIYRSINIDHINKMIYYVENQTITIISIWDTRRCPENIVTEI